MLRSNTERTSRGSSPTLPGQPSLAHRWSRERYEQARAALVSILERMGAVSAEKCVLRPALRDEARKVIGG